MKRGFVYSLVLVLLFLGPSMQSHAMPPAQAVKQAQSVYKILIVSKEKNEPVGSGTGWVAENKDGQIRIVTNSHVCISPMGVPTDEIPFSTKLQLEDGRPLKQYIWDPYADICILSIEGDSSKEIPLHLAKEASKPRDPLIVIGHPRGGPLSATIGYRIDSALIPMEWMDRAEVEEAGEAGNCVVMPFATYESKCLYFRLSDTLQVYIQPGSSGSPVINMDGEVEEMIWGMLTMQNVTLSVPLSRLQQYLK